jgi:hypothetical protein
MNYRTLADSVIENLPAGWAVHSDVDDRLILASTRPPVGGFSSNIVI